VLGDPPHELAAGVVAVEQAQRAGGEREPLGEQVEREPVRVEPGHRQPPVVVVQPDAQEHVLPLDVEVHQVLDVDQDGVAVAVHQHVVQAQLAVDDRVLGAGADRGGEQVERGAGRPRQVLARHTSRRHDAASPPGQPRPLA
jgi:hypothetical protein